MTIPGQLQGPSQYIAPALGIDALKDATALIRCVAADDAEGC